MCKSVKVKDRFCLWSLTSFEVCLFIKHTGQFEKGVAEGAVDPSLNPVVALRLSVLKDSAVWAILSEVSQSHLPSVDVLHNKQWISMH